jgi:hypothetical protein
MASTRRTRIGLGRTDRVLLCSAAWALASLAAVVVIVTAGGIVAWWRVAGDAGIAGGSRTWPVVAFAFVGLAAAVVLYGVSRACRVVARLATGRVQAYVRTSSSTASASGPSARSDVDFASTRRAATRQRSTASPVTRVAAGGSVESGSGANRQVSPAGPTRSNVTGPASVRPARENA